VFRVFRGLNKMVEVRINPEHQSNCNTEHGMNQNAPVPFIVKKQRIAIKYSSRIVHGVTPMYLGRVWL
jgi:hypothetical protein